MRMLSGVLVSMIVAIGAEPAAAQATDRWPSPPGAFDAFRARNYPAARTLLEAALKQCEASRPSGAQCIGLLHALSAVANGMNDAPAAIGYAERAITLAARTLPRDHADAAHSHAFLAEHFFTAKRYAEAEAAHCRALAIWHRLPAPDKAALSATYRYVAASVRAQGRGDEAAVYDARAGEIAGGYGPSEGTSIADNAAKTAEVMERERQFGEAEAFARRAIAFRRCIAPDDMAKLAGAMFLHGRLLAALGRDGEAEPVLRGALAVRDGITDPGELARLQGELGEVLLARVQLTDAERAFRAALTLRRAALPRDTAAIAGLLNGLSRVLQFQGRYDEAETAARELLELRLAMARGNDPGVFNAYGVLATVLTMQGKFADAEAIFRRLQAEATRDPSIDQIRLNLNHAAMLGEAGRMEEAEALLRQAVALAPGADRRDSSVPAAHYNLASTLARRGAHAEAVGHFRTALAWHEAREAPDPLSLSTISLYMAVSLAATGEAVAAEMSFRRAAALRTTLFPSLAHVARIDANWRLAAYLMTSGRGLDEARTRFAAAERGLLERMASHTDFGPAVQRELRSYRPLFAGRIATSWQLAHR